MADEIGEALQRVASAADNSGLSLEKTASWISTISSITRESASTIGRSISSILSRYESIKETGFNSEDATKLNDVTQALSKVGITATDSLGQLRPFADVMDELGAKFNTLDKNEQAYITTTLFGTYQRNRGLTLLNNYNDSLQNYQTALNAAGTAEQKFNIYQESTQAKMDRLKASWEGFWQSTVDSGLIKVVLDALNKLILTFGNLKTILVLAGTALALWKGESITSAILGLKNFSLSAKLASSSMIEFRTISAAMQLQSMGLLTTTQMLATSFKALGSAILTSFATNPIGWIAIGITAYTAIIDSAKQKQEELNQKLQESTTKANEQNTSISELVGKYNELNSIQNKDDSTRQQLKSTQEEIIKLLGLEKGAIDLVNGSYDDNIKKIKEKSLEQLKANQQTLQASYNESKNASNNAQGSSKNFLGSGYEYYNFFPSSLDEEATKVLQQANINNLMVSNRWVTTEVEGARERIKLVQEAIDVLDSEGKTNNDVYSQLIATRNNYQKSIDEENSSLQNLTKNYALMYDAQNGTPTQDTFEDFKNSAVEAIAKQQGLTNASKAFKQEINSQIDSLYPQLSGAITATGNSAIQAEDKINESFDFSEVSKQFDTLIDSIQQYSTYIQEINTNGKLSPKSIQEIIKNHKELIPYLNNTKELYNQLNQKIADQETTATNTYNSMFFVDQEFTKKVLNNRTDFVNQISEKYGIDLKNYTTLAKGKIEVEKKLIEEVAGAWAKYYDAQGNLTDKFYSDLAVEEDTTGKTAMVINRFKSGLNLEDTVKEALNSVNEDFNTVVDKFDFSSLVDNKKDLNGTSPLDKNPDFLKADIDRYANLQSAVDECTNAVSKLKAEEESLNGQVQLDNLNKQIEANQKLAKAKNDVLWEQEKERNDLRYNMSNQGFDFTGDFTSTNVSTNYAEKIQSMYDVYNGMASKTDDEKQARADTLTIIKQMEDSYKRILQLNKDVYSTENDITTISKTIASINNDKIAISFKNAENNATGLNDALTNAETTLKGLSDDDIEGKMKVYQAELKANNDLLWYWNQEMKEFAVGSEQWLKAKDYADKYSEGMATASKNINELIQKQNDIIKKQSDDLLGLYNDSMKTIEDLLKKKYEMESDAEDKAYNARKDSLDKSLDDYKEWVDKTLEEQDRLYDTQDYNDAVAESTTKINEYQTEINKRQNAANNGDLEAQNTILDYQQKIADEEKNLKKTNTDYERKLVKQTYQDNEKTYEDYIQSQKDSNEQAHQVYKSILDQQTSETSLALQAQNILANSNLETVKSTLIGLFTMTGENATNAGMLVQTQLIDRLEKLQDINKNLSSITSNSSQNYGNNPLGMNKSDFQDYLANKKAWTEGTATQDQLQQNIDLRSKYGIDKDTYTYADLKGYYANGTDDVVSMVGENGRELHVLNPNGKDSIIPNGLTEKIVSLAKNPIDFMSKFMSNINVPQVSAVSSNGVNIQFGSLLNVGSLSNISESELLSMTSKASDLAISKIKNQLFRYGR